MASGSYTYKCESCEHKQVLSRAERASHFRPRCSFCGSLRLKPVSENLVGKRRLQHDYELLDRKQRSKRSKKSGKKG